MSRIPDPIEDALLPFGFRKEPQSYLIRCIEELATNATIVRDALFQGIGPVHNAALRDLSRGRELGTFDQREKRRRRQQAAKLLVQQWFFELVPKTLHHSDTEGSAFWVRSLARASAMQYLHSGDSARKETAFVIGLLMEFGELVLEKAFADWEQDCGMTQGLDVFSFRDRPRSPFCGAAYRPLGACVLRLWGFPDDVCDAIGTNPKRRSEVQLEQRWDRSLGVAEAIAESVVSRLLSTGSLPLEECVSVGLDFQQFEILEYTLAAVERDMDLPHHISVATMKRGSRQSNREPNAN